MFFVILAFAHACKFKVFFKKFFFPNLPNLTQILLLFLVFLLLSNPDVNTIKPKVEDFILLNTSAEQQDTGLKMESVFDPKSNDDNPFASFLTSVQAAYFWINGNWSQRDDFDFWAVEILSLFASLLLVTVLQNMLIAFMG